MMKPKCLMCRTIRAANEMRKHPSHTSVHAVEHLLDEMMAYQHVDLMCDEHQDHQDRRTRCLMIEHWVTQTCRPRSNVGAKGEAHAR